jgi:2-succinyl-5-enolpyruvyl-6-hydroxy-3-cyclohexene-1-carboxylate synthase
MSVQATFAATLVDEWAGLAVSDAVVCPGSRSTPLALALAREPRVRVHMRLDERSAAFFALGLAMANGRPTVICVTSGTAAAELHPAVVEAHHARVPLIVCTADRPPELQGTGAPQTIDQVDLFTTSARWAVSPGVPTEDQRVTWRPLAVRAYAEAVQGPRGPGPVHLNLAFREPLAGETGELPPGPGPRVLPAEMPGEAAEHGVVHMEPLSGRGLLVVGSVAPAQADPKLVHELAQRLGWPVLADPLSGCRFEGAIAAADAIVRTGPPLPETVVHIGTPWLSKPLAEYVTRAATAGARVISVDPWRQWSDPTRTATEFQHVATDAWLAAALEQAEPCAPDWLESWLLREAKAQDAIAIVLGAEISEPQAVRAVYRLAAETGATLLVSASMPIRDLEWFAPALATPPRVVANRGANGIDGIVSTALGIAASGTRTIALMGDLALLHDVSGLVNLPDLPCRFVVLDNGGGGIFSFLPQAESTERTTFEQLFGTPPTSDLARVARGFGLAVHEVVELSQLEGALSESAPALIRVRVPGRARNVAVHQAINEAVRLALT